MECKECVHTEQLKKDIERLEEDVDKIKDKLSVMEIAVARGEEQTKNLFSILGEIKDSVEKIATEMQDIKNKPDSFKDTMFGFSVHLLEKAIIGGFIFYVINKLGV